MINPQWLRSFCTLVEVGHFTQTAQRLHMTQSGVSQHMHKLEQQLGVTLLDRHGKQFTLTDAGERLYAEARELVAALSSLPQRLGHDPAFQGEVRLMSPGSVGLKLYPHLLSLQQQHRQLIIDYRFAPNRSIEQAVANGETDIGIMSCAATLSNVSYETLTTEPLLLVTPAGCADLSWSHLQQLGFIDHPDGAHHAALLLSANYPEFQGVSFIAKHGFSNQIALILEPVSRGLGFTVLPAYAVEMFAQQSLIQVHRLPQPVSETLYLATRAQQPLANRVHTVIKATQAGLTC
ncbi:LysR family transcriptional regulator [Alishewanella sp. SMS8]|uniref:LysR family transcriptional regulator n=1 Tax=Alishewanella sp. SMS8 TaxID=2994676 RepID=UPI002740F5C0|nr:LysR family transcriptional regulator [Alishewanella sp. SMS8]MDP5459456.1 LysR family transcriptional regulator [Alishewanella sp. SMS8]